MQVINFLTFNHFFVHIFIFYKYIKLHKIEQYIYFIQS